MKIARYDDRAYLIRDDGEIINGLDIEKASNYKFSWDLMEIIKSRETVSNWAKTIGDEDFTPLSLDELQAPVKWPRQIFAVGMNYRDHTAEIGYEGASSPDIFTKFSSSIGDPFCEVPLPNDTVDWEVELVVILGVGGRNIKKEDALSHVAGYMVGQDLSDRTLQFSGNSAQFSLGKSHRHFSPIGPWITTLDEIAAPGDLNIACYLNGEPVQSAKTSMMVFDIPLLLHILSKTIEFYPGDLIFTGTPGGVGFGRNPKKYLKPGDELISKIEGLGSLFTKFV